MANSSSPTYIKQWRRWRYKNTTLLVLSLILFFVLLQNPYVDEIVKRAGTLGYFGAFIAGIFFVSTFTAAPAGIVLFAIADSLHPAEVAIVAGLGAMIGDFIILRIMKDKIFDELGPILGRVQTKYVRSLFRTPYFSWLLPVIGAIIIASPLPDEAGVSILGLSKLRKTQFFAITLALNTIGIFIIVSAAKL